MAIIYFIGMLVAFIINAATFSSNVGKEDKAFELNLSEKTVVTIMSASVAVFSWLFVIVFVLSYKNSYLANKLKTFFDNYSIHD